MLKMNTARPTGMLAHGSRNFVDWLTGTGFLMLHATCFFVALVVLIPWNLYTDPGDFWAADPLIRWAFLLAFHALLVGVWSLIRNVILKEDAPNEEISPAARSWQTARSTSTPVNFRTSGPANTTAATTASALLAEEWARQWLVDTGEEVVPNGGAEANGTSWGSYRNATEPVEWPQPPSPSVSLADEEEVDEPEEAGIELSSEQARTPGPLGAAARASGGDASETDEAVDPELEWRWIEAAASAWLTRKERETLTNGHRPPPPTHYDDEFASP
jgi:hypothetical protein